jgi:hypothetical protein
MRKIVPRASDIRSLQIMAEEWGNQAAGEIAAASSMHWCIVPFLSPTLGMGEEPHPSIRVWAGGIRLKMRSERCASSQREEGV